MWILKFGFRILDGLVYVPCQFFQSFDCAENITRPRRLGSADHLRTRALAKGMRWKASCDLLEDSQQLGPEEWKQHKVKEMNKLSRSFDFNLELTWNIQKHVETISAGMRCMSLWKLRRNFQLDRIAYNVAASSLEKVWAAVSNAVALVIFTTVYWCTYIYVILCWYMLHVASFFAGEPVGESVWYLLPSSSLQVVDVVDMTQTLFCDAAV